MDAEFGVGRTVGFWVHRGPVDGQPHARFEGAVVEEMSLRTRVRFDERPTAPPVPPSASTVTVFSPVVPRKWPHTVAAMAVLRALRGVPVLASALEEQDS
ncbi:hypothetical protein [Haloarcula pellucida]|uniref:Uncharacterized protein n=1 Tax=Haloarcula pellucida TaxID=1427151 RepID=A0A830GKR7_9EURY|nr:hypothetical protein [Halomicroarcula pellucida]MBX0348641.1 hypothetical protein [Halomicroarcula pellucida]GGN92456.1 hypothetical protein GCM10009030_16690 [Halomicroarcula pellucida]